MVEGEPFRGWIVKVGEGPKEDMEVIVVEK